ncbi:hypothetical protein TNCV_4150311 [Trichonephila clavipes]|uniref:Uncharacterized protein n=1 Tax=Trichonephila clavipes TaxID=2585209 RepID=A0A8X6W5S3_TRICX|nr:hypothetical protein TNCV_4150311 [Trichonephila clavipes]
MIDMHLPGHPSVREVELHAAAGLMDSDRCQTIQHHLRPPLRKKKGETFFLQISPIILHDNARSQAAQAVTDLFRSMGLGSALPSTMLPMSKPL